MAARRDEDGINDLTKAPSEADKIAWSVHFETSGCTYPLVLCAMAAKGDVHNMRRLLDIPGIDPSKSNYDGRTPLHIACDEGHFDVVKLLVEHKADVNATDRWGYTPLLCAFMHERMEIVNYLKEHGAKLRLTTLDERLADITSLPTKDARMEKLKHIFESMSRSGSKDSITVKELEAAMLSFGLDASQHKMLRQDIDRMVAADGKITWASFRAACENGETFVERALLKKLVVHDWDDMKSYIVQLFNRISKIKDGKVANYIPELGCVDPNLFGVAICTVDGQVFACGDYNTAFPVQSGGKPILYSSALEDYGEDFIHSYVGREPSGTTFNAFTLNYEDKPHNACINAGAIVLSALYHPELTSSQRYKRFSNILTDLIGGERHGFGQAVYLSEKDTAHTNFALAHFMAAKGSLPKKMPINDALDFYFQMCSTEVTTKQMAVAAATFANNGINPLTGKRVLQTNTVKRTLQLMFSCGMYDFSGEWACTVGLPAKSGVSGIIYVVVPDVLGMAIFSPPLDRHGNSVKGIKFATEFTEKYKYSMFDVVFRKRDEAEVAKLVASQSSLPILKN